MTKRDFFSCRRFYISWLKTNMSKCQSSWFSSFIWETGHTFLNTDTVPYLWFRCRISPSQEWRRTGSPPQSPLWGWKVALWEAPSRSDHHLHRCQGSRTRTRWWSTAHPASYPSCISHEELWKITQRPGLFHLKIRLSEVQERRWGSPTYKSLPAHDVHVWCRQGPEDGGVLVGVNTAAWRRQLEEFSCTFRAVYFVILFLQFWLIFQSTCSDQPSLCCGSINITKMW